MVPWTRFHGLLGAVAASGMVLSGCERPPETPPEPAPTAEVVTQAPPLPPPTLGRGEVLRALDAAGAAYAAGRPDEGENLAGRRFVIRQAFACPGAAPPSDGLADGLARWRWGPRQRTIELSLTPADWARQPAVAGADPSWEAVEGFWLVRPWLRAEGCPAVAAVSEALATEKTENDAGAPPAIAAPDPSPSRSPQTAGLAAVFAADSSRVGRRDGRPFSFTVRGDPPPQPPAAGYRLVLEGRFTAFPEGRAIRCHAEGPDVRPVCIVAAEVDRIAFEDAEGQLLSEWRPV